MTWKLRLVLCVGVAAAAWPAAADAPEGEGWQPLFNGENFDGWKAPEHGQIWSVQDGVIDCQPRQDLPGDKNLWTEDSYGDFELHAEWRLKETKGEHEMPVVLSDGSYKTNAADDIITQTLPNADSGIYLRGESKSQVNIWCWPVGSGEVWGYRNDPDMPAAVRAGCTPNKRADKPVGEWNTFRITMEGEELTVKLNGETVIDGVRLPGVPERGPIALQHHGGYNAKTKQWSSASSLVQFRGLYIRELNGAGAE